MSIAPRIVLALLLNWLEKTRNRLNGVPVGAFTLTNRENTHGRNQGTYGSHWRGRRKGRNRRSRREWANKVDQSRQWRGRAQRPPSLHREEPYCRSRR